MRFLVLVACSVHAAASLVLAAEPSTPRVAAVAKGSFEVKLQPEGTPQPEGGTTLGRVTVSKDFSGDLVGTGTGTLLTAVTGTPGSAGYVAIERVTGILHGRKGSFVFQHTGTMDRGAQQLSITVVPDSGTGELAGIEGTFTLTITEGKHLYEFAYSLPK